MRSIARAIRRHFSALVSSLAQWAVALIPSERSSEGPDHAGDPLAQFTFAFWCVERTTAVGDDLGRHHHASTVDRAGRDEELLEFDQLPLRERYLLQIDRHARVPRIHR